MAQTLIKNLKKGEFFTLRPIEYPNENQVYIRGEYDRESKTYSCHKFGDCCFERMLAGTRKVFTEFVF